jgi:phosphopantothenoylcysteine decarboxylase/phosphopantothenate--cysteine ligase
MTAAVGDYRPAEVQASKIKKDAAVRSLPLERTEDILHEVSLRRVEGQLLIGFALETENLEENARAKLRAKGLDWIVANDPLEPGAGFGEGTNRVLVLGPESRRVELPRLPKPELASRLWDLFTSGRPQPVSAA